MIKMNAKERLLEIFNAQKQEILCAYIGIGDEPYCIKRYRESENYNPGDDIDEILTLPVGYTQDQLDIFLEKLNVDYDIDVYDSGYKLIYGTVWAKDKSFWATREEYEMSCSMYWDYPNRPIIPDELKINDYDKSKIHIENNYGDINIE